MGSLLVHITSGPEAPTRAALGMLVARAAIDEGHEVSIFLAGDAVQLIRGAVLDTLVGLATGSLRESFDAIAAGGGRFYVSGMSSKARGVAEEDLEGKPAEFAARAYGVDRRWVGRHDGRPSRPSRQSHLRRVDQHGRLVVLESMTPAERLAFILRDVFRYSFTEVAEIVGRTPAECCQLAPSELLGSRVRWSGSWHSPVDADRAERGLRPAGLPEAERRKT